MSIGRVPGATGIQPSIVDAKGDLIVATAADSVDRLAVGTNEQRLVADSAVATGLKYVADTTNYAIAAKGDLLVGTAADTVSALTVGSANQVLTVDSSTATGLKWATPAAGGKVLQVVMGSTSTNAQNSTSTYADTGLTASITPSATSSKVLVIYSIQGGQKDPGNQYSALETRLLRGATEIMHGGRSGGNNTDGYNWANQYGSYLDSPSTTSSTTYKLQFRNTQNVAKVHVQANGDELSTIILMEIGA